MCRMIQQFPEASGCPKCKASFSLVQAGTVIPAHAGKWLGCGHLCNNLVLRTHQHQAQSSPGTGCTKVWGCSHEDCQSDCFLETWQSINLLKSFLKKLKCKFSGPSLTTVSSIRLWMKAKSQDWYWSLTFIIQTSRRKRISQSLIGRNKTWGIQGSQEVNTLVEDSPE